MEMAVYFPNMARLSEMDQALRYVDASDLRPGLNGILLSTDANVIDYGTNLMSLRWLNDYTKGNLNFTRLYFGQEFCQNLIPTPDEVEQSFYYACQLGWDYTYVTGGYLTDAGIDKVLRNLDRLRQIGAKAEVVFNDWGILYELNRNYPEFKLCMGRILNKQTRLNLFTVATHKLPILMDEIEANDNDIMNNQIEAYADINLNYSDYMDELIKRGVTSTDVDIVPQGLAIAEDGLDRLNIGVYFPWAFISTGRSCATAATVNSYRGFQVTETPCPRPCQKYNCTAILPDYEHKVMQRGPAVFHNAIEFANNYFQEDNSIANRLIYEPYIPL